MKQCPRWRITLTTLLATLLAACAPAVQRTTLDSDWIASPNFNERRANFIILHHTSNTTLARALGTLTSPAREVSAHYLIGRDGRLVQLVDERARAWHAGESYWAGLTDMNSASIGIELDNDGSEPYPAVQIDTLIQLLADLKNRLNIPAGNVLGHGDIAPGRKVDPSALFPWRKLAEAGFGYWCEPPRFTTDAALTLRPTPNANETTAALAAFGYDTRSPGAALAAYKRHFAPESRAEALSETENLQLNCLIELKRAGRN